MINRLLPAIPMILAALSPAAAENQIRCLSGELRIRIDEKQLAIQYSGQEMVGTLGPLSYMGARLTVAPKTLQTAAAATQVWNEYLKSFATAWNACVITKEQYAEALQKLYPSLNGDAAAIEQIRQQLAANRQVDEKRLSALLDAYVSNLKRFAEIGGSERLFQQMSVLADEVRGTREDVRQGREEQRRGFEDVHRELYEMKRSVASLSKPQEVSAKISALKTKMLAHADEAEAEYNRGYESLNAFRTADAVESFERASALVPLPEFSLALGTALRLLPDLKRAEQVLTAGLAMVAQSQPKDDPVEAGLADQLGIVLLANGDLEGAQKQTERALRIDEMVYGPQHSSVAIAADNLGVILKTKGDLDGAQRQTERALRIDEMVYGPEHPEVAADANNLGQILQAKGDLEGA
jgi:tetratricopeptide (TPR) repeat protein